MKNILITGGAGFIGSHICLTLLEQDYTIFIVDTFVNSSKKFHDWIKEILKK